MGDPSQSGSLRAKVLASGAWSIGRTVVNAVCQMATLVVLLRLLDPADFGALSVVMVVLTLTQAFTQTGVDLALVRERGDIAPALPAFFSLNVFRGLLLSGVVALLAWPMALWQGAPEIAHYLWVASAVPLLEGLRGVSALVYVREMRQRTPALIDGGCSIASVASLTALALWLRSPWAVILNQLFATGLRSLAYQCCPPTRVGITRDLAPLRRYMRFGLGYNAAQTSGTLVDTLDRLLIGRSLGLGSLGLYDRSAALANYGLHLLPQFFSTVITPAFSGIAGEPARFWRLARKYLLFVSLGGAVLCGLVRLFDTWLISLVAGERGAELVPFFRILLLCALLRGTGWLAQALLDILGRPHRRAVINGTHLAVVVVGLIAVLPSGELWQACVVVLAGGVVSAVLSLAALLSLVPRGERVPRRAWWLLRRGATRS